jgi:hypothetical protein
VDQQIPAAEGSVKFTYTVSKVEEVEVPAGKFKAIRVEEKTDALLMSATRWFAPGVGLVKMVTISGKNEQIQVLKSYTSKAKEEKPPVAAKKEEKPLHFVEKSDMKPQFSWLPHKVEGGVTEESIYVASKAFISDICLPGKIRFRDFIDPRYLKKHGLTDRDIAYEILDHRGLNSYQVADDLRTILFQVDSKGGGKEVIVVRWVVYEGRLYISPEKAPDPKTGIFKPWILRTKVN